MEQLRTFVAAHKWTVCCTALGFLLVLLLLTIGFWRTLLIAVVVGCHARIIMIDPRYYTEDISETIQSNGVTDILFLYNANTAAEDHSLYQLTAQ